MNGSNRKSVGNLVSTNAPDHRKRLITLSVIGLSGTEAQKGVTGVGKSAFCNRLVRPHFNDFYHKQITYLSQADFCSSVINQEHWLYWGEVSLDSTDYTGPTQQIRVIEHTVFLDDESFEPLSGGSRSTDYVQRATRVEFESRNKLMYIGPDQLGQEDDFVTYGLDVNCCKIDAFAVLFDVSHVNGRSLSYQSSEVLQLLLAALRSKKPVFLLASKYDQAEVAGVQEFRKLTQRKDLQKYAKFYWSETSAVENVNCAEFLYELVKVVDKRAKFKMPSFADAQLLRRHQVSQIRADFKHLLQTVLPQEEYPLRHENLTWSILLEDFSVNAHPAFMAYVAEFGANSARQLYDEHLCSIRKWWMNRRFGSNLSFQSEEAMYLSLDAYSELTESLPALREVLRRMFNKQFLCKMSYEQLCTELESHPQYDNYFRPFGQSLDKFYQSFDPDTRIPSELLQKPEARQLFQNFQRELLDEIALERQTDKFKQLLDQKDAVTPGRSFSDLKFMCPEIIEFEKALPADYAHWIYENYQKDLKNKAQQNFVELLLEHIWLFVDLIVEWRIKQADHPNQISSLNEREYNIICSSLIEDKRYRDMNGLASKRKELITKMASFISMPLTCFCLAGERCADLLTSTVVSDIQNDTKNLPVIESEVYGSETLVSEFIEAVKLTLPADKLFQYNGKPVEIRCRRANISSDATQWSSFRVRSPICLLDTVETTSSLLSQSDTLFITGPTPIFLTATNAADNNAQKLGKQLADKFNAAFIGLNNESHLISNQISPAIHFSQNQIEQFLHELCNGQMGTEYSDMRVQISFLCDDPFSISQVLSPLLEHAVQTDDTNGRFCVDVGLPDDQINIRVVNHTGSYHHWLLSKWNLNTFNGHILIYSPVRMASWRHAETAIQLLLEAATVSGPPSSNILERQVMARSILLLAVEDPSNFFTDKNSSQLLSEGAQLAEHVGCRFSAISPSMPQGAQFQLYTEFFAQLLHNQPLPNLPYTVCAPMPSSFTSKRRATYFSVNATSTFTGSASTLLSSSSASRESNLSTSCCAASVSPFTVSTTNQLHYNQQNETKSHHLAAREKPQKPVEHRQSASGTSKNGHNFKLVNIAESQEVTISAQKSPESNYHAVPLLQDCSSRHLTLADSNSKPSSGNSSSPGVQKSQFAVEMSNRLRRPLSAIGSLMSGNLSTNAENSSLHEGSSNSIAPIETHSNKIKFSPSGFRKLFQRTTAGSESSNDEHARKKIHRSSTVDAGSVGSTTPSVQINGCRLEVVPASPQNSYTSYVHVIDLDDASPSFKNCAKRPLRTVLKSLSAESEDSSFKTSTDKNTSAAVRFTSDSENIPPGRPSRLRRFADRFTRKNRQNGPRRRQSLPSKRLESVVTSSPTSASSSNSPVDITYESECQNGDDIPTFVRHCIVFIEKNGGLIMEGLYRLSGHPGLISELERQYRKTGLLCGEKLIDDSRGSRETALIAVSAALKRYLQSFNEPLIPTKLNDELLELTSDRIDIDDQTPMATRSIDAIRRLFERNLPRVNARLLAFICAHLERVASNSERNRMTIKNLALIWAGTIFRLPPSTPIMEATERVQKFSILVFFFIKHYTVLFL